MNNEIEYAIARKKIPGFARLETLERKARELTQIIESAGYNDEIVNKMKDAHNLWISAIDGIVATWVKNHQLEIQHTLTGGNKLDAWKAERRKLGLESRLD